MADVRCDMHVKTEVLSFWEVPPWDGDSDMKYVEEFLQTIPYDNKMSP